ncbi:MAG: hypothetical protein IIA40_05610 [SAR324 cluster bacterium]|nr:hypothetical protein [SAR324 cluster bacterium]
MSIGKKLTLSNIAMAALVLLLGVLFWALADHLDTQFTALDTQTRVESRVGPRETAAAYDGIIIGAGGSAQIRSSSET